VGAATENLHPEDVDVRRSMKKAIDNAMKKKMQNPGAASD